MKRVTETKQQKSSIYREKKQMTITPIKIGGKRKLGIKKGIIKKKMKTKYKRWRGKRWDFCMICDKGGDLIECHTCVHVCHVECNRNIPMNYADKRVIWRCSNCEDEDGKTQCMYAKYKPTNKRKKMEEVTGT
jgi:hypothetical protein